MRISSNIIFVVALILVSGSVEAVCRKSHVCDDDGVNCRVMDVCENSLDVPSINVTPLPPIPTLDVKPLPSTELPPVGTSHCEYKQVNGHWQNLCW